MNKIRKKKKRAEKSFFQGKTLVFLCITILIGIFFYTVGKSNIARLIRTLTVKEHTISYNGTAFIPEFVVIRLDDSVSIKNTSQVSIEIAVGRHENHKTLKGFEEENVKPEEVYTFTPLEKGVFDLHNHLNPQKLGFLIIDK